MALSDTSRDPALLHPQLQAAWRYAQAEWAKLYPDSPAPFLVATYRGPRDQDAAYEGGRSQVRFGGSLHNYKPAYAFDIAFKYKMGKLDYSFHLFQDMAERILEPLGLQWGGRWPGLVDGPHFQLPMTASDARQGLVPTLTRLTALMKRYAAEDAGQGAQGEDGKPLAGEWAIVVMRDGAPELVQKLVGSTVVTRLDIERKRLYVDVRKED